MSKHIKIWSFADADRSGKVRWTAEELGYEIEEARIKPGEQTTEPFQQINPYEKIPVAELDGKIVVESNAICILLAERHPEVALIPSSRANRDVFWQSMSTTTSTLERPVVMYFLAKSGLVDPAWKELSSASISKRIAVLSESMPGEGYICGDFSLADICAAYVLRIGIQAGLLPFEGKLENYLRRLMARPAAQAARVFSSL
jgi:glutathione S-transferase